MRLIQRVAVSKTLTISVVLVMAVMTIVASFYYSGTWYIYLGFSLVSNYFLLVGFNKNSIFFDTFIGVFFWLGFWLKTTFKLVFFDGVFKEAVGQFDGSGDAFDKALIVVMVALVGLLIARWIRLKLIFDYRQHQEMGRDGKLFNYYARNRRAILLCFVAIFVVVGMSNAYFGIYQRGEIPKTALPFGLNGVYTWLLLFGLASFSALVLRFELVLNPAKQYTVSILALLEAFVSNVSLLSRGMLLNVFALLYGFYKLAAYMKLKVAIKQTATVVVMFLILFGLSVMTVNYLRYDKHAMESARIAQQRMSEASPSESLQSIESLHKDRLRNIMIKMTSRLVIDRWVGMEGVLAVSSSPKLGWGLFGKALRERYSHYETSFYDLNLIRSPYLKTDKTKHHYISLPGAVAFFFYPGSYFFLLAAITVIGLFAALIELTTYKLGGKNLVLCALISQVVAFRLASFGYVPSQSYLLIGTIFLNLLIIYLLTFLFDKFYKTNLVKSDI